MLTSHFFCWSGEENTHTHGSPVPDQITDFTVRVDLRGCAETRPSSLLLLWRVTGVLWREREREREAARTYEIRPPTYRVDLYACRRYRPNTLL